MTLTTELTAIPDWVWSIDGIAGDALVLINLKEAYGNGSESLALERQPTLRPNPTIWQSGLKSYSDLDPKARTNPSQPQIHLNPKPGQKIQLVASWYES
jgi:hypothetical protein